MNKLMDLYGHGHNAMLGDAEDVNTAGVVNRMLANQAYEASPFGRINAMLNRQTDALEGTSGFNPVNMMLEGAKTANRWLGAAAGYGDRVQTSDILAPLGVGVMAAPFMPKNALGSAGGKVKGARPEPDAISPEAGATGSGIIAETAPNRISYGNYKSNDPHERARELLAALREEMPEILVGMEKPVSTSVGPAGKSAYIHTSFGDIRVSDHYANPDYRVGQFDTSTLPENIDTVIGSLRSALTAAKDKAAARQEAEARMSQQRREQTAPVRAEQSANRAAKEQFWREHGLENATQTAKDKAWKAFRRGEF